VLRLILGLVKGLIIGGGIGYGAYYLGLGGVLHWLTYGLVGAAVGLLVGRPFWSHLLDKTSTSWTAILKGIFGFGVGVGLYALVAKVWGGFDLSLMGETHRLQDWQFVLGGAIGALYGAFVEIDDAPPRRDEGPARPATAAAAAKKRR
jgi:hypothetical protein